MKIGSRVYHTGIKANGIIVDIDETMKKDKLKVQFFWAKYCDVPHGKWRGNRRPNRKWVMTREDSLVETDWTPGPNNIGLTGKRSLETLIRNVCEITRYATVKGRHLPIHNIAINYGGGTRMVHRNTFIINANPIWNKFTQCQIMGDLVPDVLDPNGIHNDINPNEWIIKPMKSIGGKDIRPVMNADNRQDAAQYGEYYQRMFDKVREFRVHVFLWMDNPVSLIQEKVIKYRDQLCWNKKQGGKFRYIYQDGLMDGKYQDAISYDLREKISAVSIEACKKLKYDFGGVDIGMDQDGNLKIFEVNSRMGLREQSLFTYKRMFQALRHLDIPTYREERFNV